MSVTMHLCLAIVYSVGHLEFRRVPDLRHAGTLKDLGITAELIIFGLLAAGANVLGGLLLISAGAGFMLAAIFLEIVPQTIALWLNDTKAFASPGNAVGMLLPAMMLLLAGYLVIQFFEHTLTPHFHFGEETHPEAVLHSHAAYTAIGALTIHTQRFCTILRSVC